MTKQTDGGYASLSPDASGYYPYSEDDHAVWGTLFTRQMDALQGVMVDSYLDGIRALGLNADAVPQVVDIDKRLNELTGAGVEGVPALIAPTRFFNLLSDRKFPVATFLRRREHMDYIEEPDLFHEVFGHCPLLTNSAYCDFIERFGQQAQKLGKGYSWHMFRLFWFTVEFGLIHTKDGVRAYGAGIGSSPAEAENAMNGHAEIRDFDLMDVLRTPYRIDIVQPVYFAIESFEALTMALDQDLAALIDQAKALGDHTPLFDQAA